MSKAVKEKKKEDVEAAAEAAAQVLAGREGESMEAEGLSILAKTLGPQMASELIFLLKGRIDHRKLAVLSESVQASMGHFNYRAEVDGIRYFRHIIDWELTSSASIGGLGRRQLIQTLEAAAGVAIPEIISRPSPLARNIWRRDWKAKAIREGKIPVE